MITALTAPCQQIWKSNLCPQEWRTLFLPLLKKGDLRLCSSYRSIALIPHVSKILLRIIQGRLATYIEWEILEEQAVFRKGKGMRDQTAYTRWILERVMEYGKIILRILDRATSWYLNKGWPTTWHLLYYLLLNMFQTLIRPSSWASDYLLHCVGWLEACWCYVAGFSVGDVVSKCRLHNTSTPQVSLHKATSSR